MAELNIETVIKSGVEKALNKPIVDGKSITEWAAIGMKAPRWISVEDQLPENHVTVLIVKELKSGQRNIGLGYCIPEYKHHDYTTGEDRIAPYWVCGGNNNVIYWMPLPEMPKEEDECKT